MTKQFASPSMEKYFHTLPSNVQESIMQCGMNFKNEEDMRAVVLQLVQREGIQ